VTKILKNKTKTNPLKGGNEKAFIYNGKVRR
jgi:hypothetical protein